MFEFPLPVFELLGKPGAYAVYALIGFAFGYVLESAGFGKSTKLAAQFYFKDWTVLKVMFTAILVAMLLMVSASAFELLDDRLLFVNPTYLWPGIVGGLIMGFGFIIGGFCPGTSLVALTTLKVDGIFFVAGVGFGIFMFGETIDFYDIFFNSSFYGRFTLDEWLGLDKGVIALAIIVMALGVFYIAELVEKNINQGKPVVTPVKWRMPVAAVSVFIALVVAFVGQPTNDDRWDIIAQDKQKLLDERKIQVHAGEVLEHMHNRKFHVRLLDLRSQSDFNLFHLKDSQHIPYETLSSKVGELMQEPDNSIFILMSNDEALSTLAWKEVTAAGLGNAYVLEGGLNRWLELFSKDEFKKEESPLIGELAYCFDGAKGDDYAASEPDPHDFDLIYDKKVILKLKRGPAVGGCG